MSRGCQTHGCNEQGSVFLTTKTETRRVCYKCYNLAIKQPDFVKATAKRYA